MIFYTADTHFAFKPILRAAARPFASTDDMDALLIKNWNETVSDDDTVYIVGDFAYDSGDVSGYYFEQLKGRKHLIRGNHDTSLTHQEYYFRYCESVTDYNEIDDNGRHVILCHYPIIHNKQPYMVHGHVHNRRGQAFNMLKELPHVLNAGVDINFFRPVTLDELIHNNEMYYSDKYPELFPDPNPGKDAAYGPEHHKLSPEMENFYKDNPHFSRHALGNIDFNPLPVKPVE